VIEIDARARSRRALFSPLSVGGLRLANRIVMSPMATNLANELGGVSDHMIAYYEERARSRPGLLTVELTTVEYPRGKSGSVSLRLDEDRFIPGFHRLVDAVHQHLVPIALQLGHAGGNTSLLKTFGATPIAPTVLPYRAGQTIPEEASESDLTALIDAFAASAVRAQRAGFDAVNLHGGHTYLLAQMLSPHMNRRTDEWGGDLERRLRFPLEVVRRIKARCGSGFPVIYRFSADEFVTGGRGLEESVEVARRLEAEGVDLLDITAGASLVVNERDAGLTASVEPMSYGEAWKVYLAEEIRRHVSTPVATVGVIRTPEVADHIIAEGRADAVVIGRALIADPEWVMKARTGRDAEIRPCISCNECSGVRHALDWPIRCAVNAWSGREHDWGRLEPASNRRRILVLGAGPAGMEAARVAAQRGHDVTVWERDAQAGGQLIIGSLPPFKERLAQLRDHMLGRLTALGVSVRTSFDVTPEAVVAFGPDAVVFATGVVPKVLEGADLVSARNITAWDLLDRRVEPTGLSTVVIGAGPTGCEVALHLAVLKNRVTLVTRRGRAEVAAGLEAISKRDMQIQLALHDVTVRERLQTLGSSPDGAIVRDLDGNEEVLRAELVVWASGVLANRALHDALVESVAEIHVVGDARHPRKILDAVAEGASVGRLL